MGGGRKDQSREAHEVKAVHVEKLVSDEGEGSTGTRGREGARSLTIQGTNRNSPEPPVVCAIETIRRMCSTVTAGWVLAVDHRVPRKRLVRTLRI